MFRIIKGHAPKPPLPGPAETATQFIDLTDEVQTRLETARAEAARIVAEAHDTADRIRREAQHQGLQLARTMAEQQSREEVERRLKTALPTLDRAIEALQREKTQHLQQCERHVVRLALAIAERLVRRELSRTPDISLTLIREALELAASNDRLALHLHPADYETWHETLARSAAQRGGSQRLEIVADPEITPGGCVVKTEFGMIDQQLQSQLARIEEELT